VNSSGLDIEEILKFNNDDVSSATALNFYNIMLNTSEFSKYSYADGITQILAFDDDK
jgi:hypothetical protein